MTQLMDELTAMQVRNECFLDCQIIRLSKKLRCKYSFLVLLRYLVTTVTRIICGVKLIMFDPRVNVY